MQSQKRSWLYSSDYSTGFSSFRNNLSKERGWDQSEQPHRVVPLLRSRILASALPPLPLTFHNFAGPKADGGPSLQLRCLKRSFLFFLLLLLPI